MAWIHFYMKYLKGWWQIQPHCKQRQHVPSQQHSLDPSISKRIGMPCTSQVTEHQHPVHTSVLNIKLNGWDRLRSCASCSRKNLVLVSVETALTYTNQKGCLNFRAWTDRTTTIELLICPWKQPIHLFNYCWQYLSHKPFGGVCSSCQMLLWGFFFQSVGFWVFKEKQKNTT